MGTGDLEYFFDAKVDAPYYAYRDYAYSSALPPIGYGDNWTEQISAVTNRATYTTTDALPSGGTDWFMRIREGASDYAHIRIVGDVTTNGAWGVKMTELRDIKGNLLKQNERDRMELIGNHTWRYHYYIPTNAVGERIRFHFEGVKYETNDVPFVFNVATNVWYANSTNVPYLPYTMAASGSAADKYDAIVELDGSATHLQIDFNDEVGTFALTRGTYQNFNMWSDASVGYRGHASETSGVSDAKTRWDAKMDEWTPTSYERPSLWREAFEVDDDNPSFPYYSSVAPTLSGLTTVDTYGALITPNGWNAENSAFVPRERVAPYGHSVQLKGKGEGALMLNNLPSQYIPNGIGEVEFAARVAQVPDFDGFCYNQWAGAMKNYAVSAKVTMSQLYDNKTANHRDPLDISPASPSVSLVGYYRGLRGCYEFRVTRSGEKRLAVALYRWRDGAAELLVENTLVIDSTAILASGQTTLNVGGKLNSWATGGSGCNSFNNLLVPKNADDAKKGSERWTCMCFSLFSDESTGEVRLDGFLSPDHSTSRIAADSATVRVVAYRDAGSDLARGGMYGVGSVGCQAGFGLVYTHDFIDPSNYSQGLNTSVVHDSEYAEWNCQQAGRWRPYAVDDTFYDASGFAALIPTNQTVKLKFQKQGDKDGWIDSGWETNIVAFATNTFVFAPCVASDYLVRLETGSADAEIVIDSVEVRSWRAGNTPNLDSQNGHYDEWAYTMASIETSAEIEGPSYKLEAAGTNGYVFIFNEAGTVTFTPQVDMVIDRVLLVGGGGAGGWTIGGGGGGGGVVEYDWESAPVTVAAGTTIMMRVGKGGSAHADQSKWMSGDTGGDTTIYNFKDINGTTKSFTVAKGGGGGGCWGQSGTSGNQQNGKSGGSGGGSANGNGTSAGGTSPQGNAGGRANNESPGGGGGAGGAGGAGVATSDGKSVGGNNGRHPSTGYISDGKAGAGGVGRASDITGSVEYYGGGGGGGAGNSCFEAGAGGLGGGGTGGHGGGNGVGAFTSVDKVSRGENGENGKGGGGGGGGFTGAQAGGDGGSGCVILRVRTASKLCVLQPTRSYPIDGTQYENSEYPMSVRSKYMDNGLSLFSFSYVNADSNAVLRLQISTNLVDYGEVYSRTREGADGVNWTTLTNWSFKGLSANDLKEGTRTYFISLRSPQKGLMRLIMDPSVVSNALTRADNLATRDLNYGKIMITRVFCYDEPPLDGRSWWGWNLHNEGWNGGNDPGRWAYLTDSPDGLSCSLNFSALKEENDTSKPETYGIGLGEPDKTAEYAENNPFVQCPEMTNGIGSVSFRARTFETNATAPSVVLLYGALYPDSYQPDPLDGQGWTRLAEFVISNNTYQTYSWKTNEMTTAIRSIRLEVGGARNGRDTSYAPLDKAWEKPSSPYRPIQRVFLDEVTVAEPVGPRLKFFDVRPFRDNLNDTSPKAITNINDRNEQPLLNESWGIQARIEPQQMEDELDLKSIVVKMAAFVGKRPWGYQNWKDNPTYEAELKCVDTTNLIYRSTYDNPASVIQPVGPADGDSYAVVQYHVWAEYKSKDASEDQKPTSYSLSASDWVIPEWYWPMDFNKELGFGQDENFSAFTILDTISPGRAWFNEVNYYNDDYSRKDYQFIELMMPDSVDLTDWSIRLTDDTLKNGILARFGSPAQPIALKAGKRPGIDSTNHFTVVTFVPPSGASMFSEGQSDGIWNMLSSSGLSLQDGGLLKKGELYGLELMRPSGVVEHQIVVSGTNIYAGTIIESKGDVTNFVNRIKASDGSEAWFWAGADRGGATDTLGVWRGHGEQFWDGGTTWTNDLTATPGELNLRNGKRQFLDEWLLPPNGTNVWIYAIVTGSHVWQYVDGDPTHTNRNTMLVVQKNASTNIRYIVDAWYEMANCTTNNQPVTPTAVPGQPRTFKIALDDLQETTTVMVGDRGDSRLFGTNYAWQVAENDPYKPAILDWLLRKYSDKNPDDIVPAEHWFQGQKVGELDLKAMYWLDIPPTDGHDEGGNRVSDWRLLYGFSDHPTKFTDVEDGVTYDNNVIVTVQMMLTNTVSNAHHPPYTIQGMQPGSSSADDYASSSANWTSATFKVTCAVNTDDLRNSLKPVKWFVFDRNSFNDDGIAYIEIPDQSKPNVPGFDYGWHYYLGTSFSYKSALSDGASGLYSTEVLRAVHTNNYHSTTSP